MELDRVSREAREVVFRDRSRERSRGRGGASSPEDRERERERERERGYRDARAAMELAKLQDELDKTTNELRRAQAEIRLNQSDYDRSHVEIEQMQEKVRPERANQRLYSKELVWDDKMIVN